MGITNSESIDNYECTYSCDEDRHTECQYFGNICEQCIHFKKNEVKKIECPFFKDECINPAVPCEDCFLLNTDNDYLDDEDIEDFDDEDIIIFVNFDIEDLPF